MRGMQGFMGRIDRLGALLGGLGALACLCLPFVLFKANRILPGEPSALLNRRWSPSSRASACGTRST